MMKMMICKYAIRTGRCVLPGLVMLASLSATGCMVHRTVVNQKVLRLDASNLRIGETTWVGALEELGPPVSANTPQQLLRAQLDERSLKYVAAERKTIGLMVPVIVGVLPFRWSDLQNTRELLLEFDENHKLTGVYETRREAIWRPWAKEPERKPPVTRMILGGDSS